MLTIYQLTVPTLVRRSRRSQDVDCSRLGDIACAVFVGFTRLSVTVKTQKILLHNYIVIIIIIIILAINILLAHGIIIIYDILPSICLSVYYYYHH